jgi:predicted transport protein
MKKATYDVTLNGITVVVKAKDLKLYLKLKLKAIILNNNKVKALHLTLNRGG